MALSYKKHENWIKSQAELLKKQKEVKPKDTVVQADPQQKISGVVSARPTQQISGVVQARPTQQISGVVSARPTQTIVPPMSPAGKVISNAFSSFNNPSLTTNSTSTSLLKSKIAPLVFPVTNIEPIKKQIEYSASEKTRTQNVDTFTKSMPGAVLRAIPRAAISVGSSVFPTEDDQELVPKTKLARFIFGDDSIGTFKQEGEKFSELAAVGGIVAAEKLGKTNLEDDQKITIINDMKKYKWLTLPLGILSVGSDLVPGVGGAKKQVTKEVSEQLIKKYGLETANELVRRGAEVAERALKDEGVVKQITPLSPKPALASALPSQNQLDNQIKTRLAIEPTKPGSKIAGPIVRSETPLANKTSVYDVMRNPYDEVNSPKVKLIIDQLPEDSKAAVRAASLLDPTNPNPVNRNIYTRMRESVAEGWTKIRETVQDDWIRVKKLLEKPGVVRAAENIDPYMAETLVHGRIASRIDEMKTKVSDFDKGLFKTSKQLKVKDTNLRDDINEFLRSRHAPERNFELGDGAAGITTEQAAKNLDVLKAKPYFKEVERLGNQISDMNRQTLEILKDGGVISEKSLNDLRKIYPNHIPLNRIMPGEEDIVQALSERGFSVSKTGLYKAKGSKKDVADILTNVTANLEQAIIRSEKNRVDNATLAFARANKHLGLFEEIPARAGNSDPLVLKMFENGKRVHLRINDVHLAAAFRGVGRQYLPSLLKFVGVFSRLYSGLATRFNPEFALPNKIRDLQEMMVYVASEKELGFKSAGKAVFRDLGSTKDVFDWVRGKDTAGSRLYNQMRLDGGTTGGMSLSTRAQVELDIDKIRKLNRSNTRKAAQGVLGTVDKINTIIEDSTRLSVYREALAKGLSREQAAVMAKNATINFNKMGTGGPVINALYMFSNASIQGSTKMLRAMKNPKVAAAVVVTVGTAVAVTNEYNDKVDPDWRDKVSKWDRMNNLIIALPTNDGIKYIKIPVSWGVKPIKAGAEYVMDLTAGRIKLEDAVEGTLSAAMDAYNPVGGTDIKSAVVPTILDTPVDIWSNRAWHGGKIKPDTQPDAAEATKFFQTLQKSQTGKTIIGGTSWLYKATDGKVDLSPADINYAYEQLTGGTGRFTTRLVNTLTAIGQGKAGDLPVKEVPLVNRFLGSKTEEEVGDKNMPVGKFYDIKKQDTKEASFRKMEARGLYDRLMEMPQEERSKAVRELQASGQLDKEMVDTLFNVFKEEITQQARQRTDFEEQIKKAPVKTRGKYLYEITKEMDNQEKASLIKDWIQKKIITEDVMKQFIEAASK